MSFRYSSDDGHFGPAKDYGNYDDTRGLFAENDSNDMSNVDRSPGTLAGQAANMNGGVGGLGAKMSFDPGASGGQGGLEKAGAAVANPGTGAASATPWGAIIGALAMYKGNLDRLSSKHHGKLTGADVTSLTYPGMSNRFGGGGGYGGVGGFGMGGR